MPRPSRLEILEYALTGAATDRGVGSGFIDEEEEEELSKHIEWLEAEIERITRPKPTFSCPTDRASFNDWRNP